MYTLYLCFLYRYNHHRYHSSSLVLGCKHAVACRMPICGPEYMTLRLAMETRSWILHFDGYPWLSHLVNGECQRAMLPTTACDSKWDDYLWRMLEGFSSHANHCVWDAWRRFAIFWWFGVPSGDFLWGEWDLECLWVLVSRQKQVWKATHCVWMCFAL